VGEERGKEHIPFYLRGGSIEKKERKSINPKKHTKSAPSAFSGEGKRQLVNEKKKLQEKGERKIRGEVRLQFDKKEKNHAKELMKMPEP